MKTSNSIAAHNDGVVAEITSAYNIAYAKREDHSQSRTFSRKAIEELQQLLNEFNSNPAHWSNNKRKMHGIPLLRKESNRPERKKPSPLFLFTLHQLVDTIITEDIVYMSQNFFSNFSDANKL